MGGIREGGGGNYPKTPRGAPGKKETRGLYDKMTIPNKLINI